MRFHWRGLTSLLLSAAAFPAFYKIAELVNSMEGLQLASAVFVVLLSLAFVFSIMSIRSREPNALSWLSMVVSVGLAFVFSF